MSFFFARLFKFCCFDLSRLVSAESAELHLISHSFFYLPLLCLSATFQRATTTAEPRRGGQRRFPRILCRRPRIFIYACDVAHRRPHMLLARHSLAPSEKHSPRLNADHDTVSPLSDCLKTHCVLDDIPNMLCLRRPHSCGGHAG